MTEQELWVCLGKSIKLIPNDGQEVIGVVEYLTPAADNEDGEASISLNVEGYKDSLIEFTQSEIKMIEIIN